MIRTALEAALEEATREFVSKILTILRSASLGEVASLGASEPTPAPRFSPPRGPARSPGRPPRAAAATRANASDLADRIVDALRKAGEPLGARPIADAMGVSVDELAKPLLALRESGRIVKQGDKRATKYALAE